MTGFSGLTFTSRTGARSVFIPRALSSRPVMAAASPAYSGERVAPKAMFPGKTVAGSVTRATTPPSWSVEIKSGTPEPCRAAISCRPFERELTCPASSGWDTLPFQLK